MKRKPYLSSGKKEGVRLYAVAVVLTIPAILLFWFRMLLGGFGEDRSLSTQVISDNPAATVRASGLEFDQEKVLSKPTKTPQEVIKYATEVVTTAGASANNVGILLSPTSTSVPTEQPTRTNNGSTVAMPAQSTPVPTVARGSGYNQSASPAVLPAVENKIVIYYAPGYEWMKACEGYQVGSDDYWKCIQEAELKVTPIP